MKKYLFAFMMVLPMAGFILSACQKMNEAPQEAPKMADPRLMGFKGKIAKSYKDSVEAWPEEQTFTGKEPNVLILLLDDVGFAQIGAFGGLIETPNMDRLAANGLYKVSF